VTIAPCKPEVPASTSTVETFSNSLPLTPTYASIEDFVAHVIYDGRFLSTFTTDPDGVAESLGISITSDVSAVLRGRDRGLVLSEVTERMTREYSTKATLRHTPDVHADFGISGIVVIGAIAIIVVVDVACGSTPIVTDNSAEFDSKL